MNMKSTLLAACLIVSGCASSTITSFKDPAFSGHRFGHISVFALGMDLETAVAVEGLLCQKMAPTVCDAGKNVISPVRQFSPGDIDTVLKQHGIDAVLMVALESDQAESPYLGNITSGSSQTSATASLYGNSMFGTATTTTTASSVPVYGSVRQSVGNLGLFDSASGQMIWRGQVKVSGRGFLNTTDKAFIASATDTVAAELKASGLFE
jgi:hypothetical protein